MIKILRQQFDNKLFLGSYGGWIVGYILCEQLTANIFNIRLGISFQQIEYSLEYKQEIICKVEMTSNLFAQITGDMLTLREQMQQPTLKNSFLLKQHQVSLTLTENYIVLQHTLQQTTAHYYLSLNFDVKYQTLYHSIPNQTCLGIPMALTLERQNCSEKLTFNVTNPSVAETWNMELEKKINQRNFHNLFKAKKKIGKGAFATVYLAERLRDHKMVAVKAFSKQKQYSGDKGKQSLQNEIKLMRRLNHPNISKLQGVYQTQNSIYVILEYLQGKQLNQVLKNKQKLEANQVKEIIHNLLKGLNHLSKHKIIHRDFKPENIIFKRDNYSDVAICDFGLATHADQEKYLFVRCGTPGFVAPQIINIKDMSTKSSTISDIFSAGIIFHYLLFGCSVFHGKKYNEILQQNRQCSFNFDKEMYGRINDKAFDLLAKMLEKDPSKRITAQAALAHPFFNCEMDIELQNKILFKNASYSSIYPFKVRQIQTSTVSSRLNNEKYFNFDTKPRQSELYNYI